ncbi:MAG: extracellular solute-binding protein, partial [Ruminiclostridium sp.]|nr:extracellular solute-binding protein [Ruminiclostridium sp.]
MCMIRRRISRTAATVILSAALLLTTDGCTQNGNGYVYYLNYKPEADSALQDIAKLYTKQTGVPVKVITAASGSYQTTLAAQMNKSSPPTLFVCESEKDIRNWDYYCYDLGSSPGIGDLVEDTDLCVYSGTGELKGI